MMTERCVTSRFGEIEFTLNDVWTFAEGILGFPSHQRFVLVEHKPGSPFNWLQSVDEGTLAFLVVDPTHYVADYGPEMPESVARELGLTMETPIVVYTIVTIPPGRPEDMTLNLAGPLVLNVETRTAKQVVLEDESYLVRHPAFEKRAAEAAA